MHPPWSCCGRSRGTDRDRGRGSARRMSRREALAHSLWDMALRGDLTACKLVLEYLEGKPVQRVEAALGRLEQPDMTADELAASGGGATGAEL